MKNFILLESKSNGEVLKVRDDLIPSLLMGTFYVPVITKPGILELAPLEFLVDCFKFPKGVTRLVSFLFGNDPILHSKISFY